MRWAERLRVSKPGRRARRKLPTRSVGSFPMADVATGAHPNAMHTAPGCRSTARLAPLGAVAFALLLAPPRSVDAWQAREAPVRVEVRGVEEEMRDNVMATLSLARQPSRTRMPEERVRLLMNRVPDEVQAAMEPFGYYAASSSSALAFDGRRWRVTVDVEPGSPVRLVDALVRIEGPGAQDTALVRIRDRAGLAIGQPLAHASYESVKERLIGTALDRGYLDAVFDSSAIFVDRGAREARAVLVLRTGPRFTLGEVTFFQDALDPELLQDLVPWVPGDAFSRAQLLELQTSLTAEPYFSSAEIIPARDRAEGLVVPIEVLLTPAPRQLYSVGGGYGTDTGARVTFSAEFRRLNRAGHRATVDAWLAQVERRATGSYLIPLGERLGTVLSLTAGWVDANPVTSETETWLVGATVDGIRGDWRTQVSTTLERASFSVGTQSGVSTLLLLGSGLSHVVADDRIEPARGSLFRVRARGGHDALFSDVRLFDMGIELRWIRGFGDRYRVLWRGEVGALFSSDFSSLPPSLRYFAGGDRSVRGYAYEALGPVDEFGDVIGGTKLLVTAIELDAAVRRSWRVALFADVGNALDSFEDPYEAGAGVGIRWRSPVGMVRLDGAFAVTRRGWPFRLHLNLGPEL
jgi:translocation and assembly module TamA